MSPSETTNTTSTRELLGRIEDIERQMSERRQNSHALNTKVSEMLGDVQVDVDKHEKALEQLSPAINAMVTQVTEIKAALVGDAFGNRGLVGRFEDGERERIELRRLVDSHDRKLWAAGLTLSAVWGLVVMFKEKLFR